MCLIALKKRGSHLSDDEIRYDFATNGNGAGIMYAKNGRVYWEKGFFDVNKLLDRWHELISDDMVAALHTRIATVGDRNSVKLCHPFPLDGSDMFRASGDAPLVMMHNGQIPESVYGKYAQTGDSDTSAFGRMLTPILNNKVPDNGYGALVEAYSESNSRFLFMDGNGNVSLIGKWYEEDGIMFSNNRYQGKQSRTDWEAYGRKRGFFETTSTFSKRYTSPYNYTYVDPNPKPTPKELAPVRTSYSFKGSPDLFSTSGVDLKEDEIDENEDLYWELVEAKAADEGFVTAETYEDEGIGELNGTLDPDTIHFIFADDIARSFDTQMAVYEYNRSSNTFVESKDLLFYVYPEKDISQECLERLIAQ